MEFNLSKSLIIFRDNVRKHAKFTFNSVKCLIIINHENIIFPRQTTMLVLITSTRRILIPIDIVTPDIIDKLVLHILIYGCGVRYHSNLEHINLFCRNFIRRLLKLGKITINYINSCQWFIT